MSKFQLLATFAITLCSQQVRAQSTATVPSRADVPVQSVMLFSSGVGFFEHAGTVRGNSATELRFKTAQINDILKSLVLQDQDGGRVSAITYPSQDPVAKTLRSFQVDITANPTLGALLNQLRGARVSVSSRNERITGSVLGVESRTEISASDKSTQTPVLNLLSGATIRAIELPSITSLSLEDPQLQDELAKALSALSQARDKDKKPVTISFNGTGDRRVRIGYVVETPIWKTSYRLLLDDKVNRIQGWAIVENQTESDWNNIALSLVSGRPISFMMDLYQPLYLTRPTVTQQLFAGLRPRTYDGGIASVDESMVQDFAGKGVAGGRAMAAPSATPPAGPGLNGRVSGAQTALELSAVSVDAANYSASVQSKANAARMGELFQYSVGNVTLARQKSAMLPIITDSISIDRLSIYNASVLAGNPLNGVRLKNTTGKHLLEGPVTVLDQNRYAGDAQINNVPPGQERLLSYGIDLEMTIDDASSNVPAMVMTGHILKGVLTLEQKLVLQREYRAQNKSDKDKTLLIEHPSMRRVGYKLVDTQKPVETTETEYRFEGLVSAHKTSVLKVREEMVQLQRLSLIPTDINSLVAFTRNGEIPPLVREALSKVITLKQAIVDTDHAIDDRTAQIADITAEQNRLRENMKTVAQNSDYYKRLLQKLNDQESELERLSSERIELQKNRAAKVTDLDAFINALTIE